MAKRRRGYYLLGNATVPVAEAGFRRNLQMSGMRQITPIAQFDWKNEYAVSDLDGVLTPALLIYPEIVEANIRRTIELLEGRPQRWRPHVKTAKLASTMRALVGNGVDSFKCATTLELRVACEAGARDVLVAYPLVSANARRVRELAEQFPRVRVSVLVEDEIHVQQWTGSSLGIFVDINPGMDRTGIAQNNTGEILKIIAAISEAGLEFRGIHYYDGHLGALDFAERRRVAHAGYDQLIQIVSEIEGKGFEVEVITAGTPCFPCSLDYAGFASSAFRHRVSPGTIVYCDATSLAQLPPEYGYRPAAVVLTRVVSHPTPGIITCDAGHKSVSADAGVPTCVV